MNTPTATPPSDERPPAQQPKSVAARFDGIIRRLTKAVSQRPA